MTVILKFFTDYVGLIFLLLFLAAVLVIRRLSKARNEVHEAIFGLEMELALRHQNQAVAALVSIIFLAIAELVLVAFLVPMLPGLMILATPTGNLGILPTSTLPQEIMATISASTPLETFTIEATGCIPGQIAITFPRAGDQIQGKITLTGSANIPNFGFYKYEFSPINTDQWTTVQAGRETKLDGELGDWDTTEITPGDYHLRLVVTDNQGLALPACVVPIRIVNP